MKKRLYVKYCGFTRKEDLDLAASLGVNAVGFIFYKRSMRYIEPELVKEISKNLPSSVERYGIFVGDKAEDINAVARISGITKLQLFADEIEKGYDVPVVPVYRISNNASLAEIMHNETVLLDTFSKTEAGGSGKTFDWSMLKNSPVKSRAIIAGGINADNLTELLYSINPYGIDVSSGIEVEKGIKSHEKMRQLMSIVEDYNEHN